MKKRFLSAIMMASIAFGLNGQVTEVGQFLAAGPEDAQKLLTGYLSPYFNAFGASLTGGWYNTAKPHQLGGFDLTMTFNTSIVPSSDKTFDIAELGLESLTLADATNNEAPTVAGEKTQGPALNYDFPDPIPDQSAFSLPKGTNFPIIPTPMIQAGIGLIKDTEITGRFMPNYNFKDSEIGMWGVGVKHGLKQYIPFIKRVPVLHLTVQYGYTQLNSSVGMEVNPEDIGATDATTTANWDNQSMDIKTQSHTANLLFSADLPVVCFYAGVGIANTKSSLDLIGDFPVIDATASLIGTPVVTDGSVEEFGRNPISMTVENSDGSTTKPRLNAGMRLKFGVVTFHGDYTYANYSVVTAGIGISFR